jgi:hypothetical protein
MHHPTLRPRQQWMVSGGRIPNLSLELSLSLPVPSADASKHRICFLSCTPEWFGILPANSGAPLPLVPDA